MLSLLGEGVQGCVYLVQHRLTFKKYALKIYKKEGLKKFSKHIDFGLEGRVMENLDHPFIVKMISSYETKNYNALLMEFCKGGDMFFHLKKVGIARKQGFAEPNV
mmetsp:Transcript_10066/g.11327  ORF Transcript_10066/g.11327 Transcript_10066/m.11327 type:complete len:105 (+) Transcript_10066:376-690(+)